MRENTIVWSGAWMRIQQSAVARMAICPPVASAGGFAAAGGGAVATAAGGAVTAGGTGLAALGSDDGAGAEGVPALPPDGAAEGVAGLDGDWAAAGGLVVLAAAPIRLGDSGVAGAAVG